MEYSLEKEDLDKLTFIFDIAIKAKGLEIAPVVLSLAQKIFKQEKKEEEKNV